MNDAGRIGFVIRGDYESASTYDFLDIVFYGGSSYVAKKLTTGNEPNRDNEFWHIFAEKADEGDYVLKSDYATTEKAGLVKPDGTTITVSEDGTISGSNQAVVDAELNSESENPVQNKVISTALGEKSDATQLDSTVEGSYAEGVAEEISLINTDLAKKTLFTPIYATINNGLISNALDVNLNNALDSSNKTGYVYHTSTTGLPSDCSHGIREVYYYNNSSVFAKIIGSDFNNVAASWINKCNNGSWHGWIRNVTNNDITTNAELMENIPHSTKITIPFGGCQSIVGCLFDRVVILNAYFQIKEDIPAGGTIFNLPQTYRPQYATIAIGFFDHATTNIKYYGGINKNGVIYPDMIIPAGTALVVNASFFKY